VLSTLLVAWPLPSTVHRPADRVVSMLTAVPVGVVVAVHWTHRRGWYVPRVVPRHDGLRGAGLLDGEDLESLLPV